MPLPPSTTRWIRLAALLVASALATGPASAVPTAVDLALVLAVDSSASVDSDEFSLQMDGIAAGFRDQAVQAAIAGNSRGAILVTLVEWSGEREQRIDVPWTLVDSAEAAEELATQIENQARLVSGGATAVGAALRFALTSYDRAPLPATRRVVDLSGDGSQNDGPDLAAIRTQLLTAGITINGLAIVNDEPDIAEFYRAAVIGGPGAFLIRADGYQDFAEAMRRKLLREIGVPALTDDHPLPASGISTAAR